MGNTRTLAHPPAARLGRGGERGYVSDFQKVDRAPSARMMKSGHAFGMDDAKNLHAFGVDDIEYTSPIHAGGITLYSVGAYLCTEWGIDCNRQFFTILNVNARLRFESF